MENKYKLVLGSASPRRKELLSYTFCSFEIHTSQVDERSTCTETHDWVMDIARQKSEDVLGGLRDHYSRPLVIGADTIVVLGGEILGKPKDKNHAREMLKKLSGRRHQVLTGVSLNSIEHSQRFYCSTEVEFYPIEDELLELYLETGESLDKAGSYGIQSYALSFIKSVDGSYSNVVGLPVAELILNLKDFLGEKWRDKIE